MSDLLVPFTLRLPDASLRDCAAAQGTPLSEALHSVGVDPAWVHLCRVSGSEVKPTDRVGFEVAAGDVIMFVADPSAMLSHGGWPFRDPRASAEEKAERSARARAVSAGTLVGSALVVVLVEVFVLASPFVWGWQPDPVSRLAFGSLSVFYALVLGYIAPAWARTECVAAASLVFGLACLQIVPADNPVGSAVAPIVVTWGGLLYCLSYGVRRVEGVEDAISVPRAAWAVATVCATLMILGNSLVAHPAFLAIAAGAALVWLSPQLTVRAGSFVLIDIGEVMTVALPGRQQEPPKPKAMNARASHEAYASWEARAFIAFGFGGSCWRPGSATVITSPMSMSTKDPARTVSWGESHTSAAPAAIARNAGCATREFPRIMRVAHTVATAHAARGTEIASSTPSTRRTP